MEIKGNRFDLEQLTSDLARGSVQAFDQLYSRYVGKVYNFLLKITADPAAAKDLTQELFIRLWQRRTSIDPSQNFEAWLFVCAKNLFLNELRRQSRNTSFAAEARAYMDEEDLGTIENIDYHFAEQDMARIVRKMPPQRRKVFLLARVYGLSVAEIAEQMNISQRTVENQLYQARKFITSKIKVNS